MGGPAKSAAGGEVIAVNEDLVANPISPMTIPMTPAGWSSCKPEEWDSVKGSLVTGDAVTAPYEAKMDSEGFGGCE